MLQAIRKSVRATILSSARQGLFFVPLIFILTYFLGLNGVEMCQPASDFLAFLLAIPLTCGVLAEMKRKRNGVAVEKKGIQNRLKKQFLFYLCDMNQKQSFTL